MVSSIQHGYSKQILFYAQLYDFQKIKATVSPFIENLSNPLNMLNQIRICDMVVYGKVECIRQEQIIKIKADFV